MAGRQVRRLLGREPSALIGLTSEEVFPRESEIGSILARSMERQDATRDELIKVEDGVGGEAQFLLSVEPLAEEGGRLMGTLLTIRDAQSRGEIAAQLDLAHRLTALNRLTRGVAHEIKNPLNAMRLHLEVLKNRLDGDVPEVDVITREIARLDRVVKTFLDFNRPVEPQMRRIDLAEMAHDVARLVQPEAAVHGVTVSHRDDGHAAWIQGDPDLLKQAVLNVVMNAIEAMNGGGALLIESRCEARECEISVSDTGPGIPPEIRDKIFNLYFSTKAHGSGIGLAMAFRFVQLHDGRIEFATQSGQGTTFRFVFPEALSHPSKRETELSRGRSA
jgi:signal transduction histidine kinase